MVNKMNGGHMIKKRDYIKKILLENKNIYKYEVPFIIKAFKNTFKYFCENAIEFQINDICNFVKHHKKANKMYVRYRDEFDEIPEHDIFKFKLSYKLKDYLNNRNDFKESKHREYLPDGEMRSKKIG